MEGVAKLPLQSEQELLAANGVKRTPPLVLTYRTQEMLASHSFKKWRRGAGSNRRIKVLQTFCSTASKELTARVRFRVRPTYSFCAAVIRLQAANGVDDR
jgi:hypothetical protein